ncbi:MAG: type I-C CRISPR-associated protein Cas5 [Deltaproteobacteria bacterium]|nr:type I-C CRISPR-associated protein Cas5 [Deltaproteobacteria bacterium]MBW2041778.1 type I-C CRISPR-associated protein Cas5 [Deltaproteobacteria bacterium]
MNGNGKTSGPFRLKVWGRNACFTRPEMKVERVSYDVMTPSAARGVLEAILWKPAIRWLVERIDVLAPIRWESVRRNEVGCVMSPRTGGIFVEEQRQQRAGLFLREVAYIIHARFEMTGKAGPEDNLVKFQEMFLRRAENGQCFHRPYLGCREFSAEFELVRLNDPLPEPIAETRDLGWMLYDIQHDNRADKGNIHFCTDGCRPSFFRAELKNGVMRVPPADSGEVRK